MPVRTAQRRNPGRDPVSRTASSPAPIGGLNTRDALAAMNVKDAVILENFFPQPSSVALRDGFTIHATGMSGMVESLMAYASPMTDKLFAGNGSSIFQVTSGGPVGAAEQTGLTSVRFQHANFGTPGGHFMFAVNGDDEPRLYNGTAWILHTITGVTTATLIHVNAHKSRLWFVERDTLHAWFLPLNSIGGTASLFDLSSLFTRGGFLMAMATWTLDSGTGPDDLAVFISSKGQLAIFSGTDPATIATWQIVGIFDIGSPIGRRCFVKFQTELLILTQNGLFPISKAMSIGGTTSESQVTEKIVQSFTDAVLSFSALFGWQVIQFPRVDMLLINVPITSVTSKQFVMNLYTGAWALFTGWHAACWEIFTDLPFFGGNGAVNRALDGQSDAGANIVGEMLTAFNYFGSPTQLKQILMVRPILNRNTVAGISVTINTDFDKVLAQINVPSGLLLAAGAVGIWDAGLWDINLWSAGLELSKDWQSTNAVGYSAAAHVKIATNAARLELVSLDYVYQSGGVL